MKMMRCKFGFRLSLSEEGPVSHQALDTERRPSQMERRRCSGVRIRVGETRQNAKEGRLGLLFAGWMETRTCGRVGGWMEPRRTATSPGEGLPRSTAERVRLAGQRAAGSSYVQAS